MEVNGREATNDKELAFVADGELPAVASVASKANETKPPKRFTEDTLLGVMEAPGKYVDDDDVRDALKARGLGTPATRAAIIEGLLLATEKKAPYLVREGKELHPTDKAMKLIAFLREQGVDELCSPTMTGDWEIRLRQMEQGNYAKAKFMAEINEMVHAIIKRLKDQAAASPQYAASKLDTPCPKCGGEVREEGLFFACGGCDFKVWKKISGRAMSKAEVTHMLSTGKSNLPRAS
ncbi:MAG: DNA topoisomerase [Burkholderia sp.]